MNDILTERVQDIIASTFGLDPSQVPPEASARTLPAWSSLAHLRLLSAIEQEFGIGLTMNEMISMDSISAIKRVLAGKGIEA
jgi:acyl carrier protein